MSSMLYAIRCYSNQLLINARLATTSSMVADGLVGCILLEILLLIAQVQEFTTFVSQAIFNIKER
eukprot:scaffold87016_cov54-Cyclotella_meneghiniana.AAC.4